MPTYNGERYLGQALDSVLAQGAEGIEIIIVDDGSTDGTLSILKSYAASLSMHIIAREHRGNWVSGTNEGMTLARGDYMCWLHQDDVWHPTRLRIMRQLIYTHPAADLFVHPVWYIDKDGRTVGTWRCPLWVAPECLSPAEVVERLLIHDFFASTAPIFRSAAARNSGPVDESLWSLADWDFWLKLAAQGRTCFWPRPLSSFRVHKRSLTIVRIDDYGPQYDVILDRHIPRWAGLLPNIVDIARVSRFSADVNIAFARWASGQSADICAIIVRFVLLGPSGWLRYLRDSRICERVIARLRAGLLSDG